MFVPILMDTLLYRKIGESLWDYPSISIFITMRVSLSLAKLGPDFSLTAPSRLLSWHFEFFALTKPVVIKLKRIKNRDFIMYVTS